MALERVLGRFTRMWPGMELFTDEERLERLCLFSTVSRKLSVDLIEIQNYAGDK